MLIGILFHINHSHYKTQQGREQGALAGMPVVDSI
jgi:hypothetical protein